MRRRRPHPAGPYVPRRRRRRGSGADYTVLGTPQPHALLFRCPCSVAKLAAPSAQTSHRTFPRPEEVNKQPGWEVRPRSERPPAGTASCKVHTALHTSNGSCWPPLPPRRQHKSTPFPIYSFFFPNAISTVHPGLTCHSFFGSLVPLVIHLRPHASVPLTHFKVCPFSANFSRVLVSPVPPAPRV